MLFLVVMLYTGVALTQISAYITHKNLAARKIIEAMRTAYTQKTRRGRGHTRAKETS